MQPPTHPSIDIIFVVSFQINYRFEWKLWQKIGFVFVNYIVHSVIERKIQTENFINLKNPIRF